MMMAKTHCRLGGRHDNDKEHKKLAVQIPKKPGKRDEGQDSRRSASIQCT